MKRLILFVILLAFCISGCDKDTPTNSTEYGYKFEFITENYEPLNYVENNELTGLAPDVLREICTNLNIPFKVSVQPWEEGYQNAQNTSNAVLFSTVLNSTRKDLFKWAGPIASLDWVFYSKTQSSISLTSLDDAKAGLKIGVMRDFSITQYLSDQGFTNFVYVTDNIEGFTKLLSGEIDLFPSDEIAAKAALESSGKNIWSVTPQLTFLTDFVYFAFNKQVPDNVVADFQNQIDIMKSNGKLNALYQKYMKKESAPSSLQIYTEQYPPLTYRNSFGEITGFGTDIVKEIMRRNNIYSGINLSLWSNGYKMIQENPNFCLFTMERTIFRENLFQWVGPVGTNTTYFYSKAGSGIVCTNLTEAKNLAKVGTVNSWFSDEYLREQGFTNLVSDSDPAVMVTKLMNGEIDVFVCSAVTFPEILKELGFNLNQVTANYALISTDYYIAFSLTTPADLVMKWQAAFDVMKSDGTYSAIYSRWF